MGDTNEPSIDRLEEEGKVNRLTAARRAELGLSTEQWERGLKLDLMAARLLGEERLILFRELAVLPRELSKAEQVLEVAYAHLFFGGGLLALTDRRVVFVNHRILLPGVAVKRFPLESIREHSLVRVKDFGRLTLRFDATGWNADREFDYIKPLERALAIDAELTELLSRPKAGRMTP